MLDENLLTFAQAAAQLPKIGGKKPHLSTLWRWARRGLRGTRLEVLRIGGRFVTSREALERFFTALAAAEPRQQAAPDRTPTPSPRAREKAIARAKADLEKAGI